MIVTDDETMAKRARYLTTQAKDDALEYIHGETGYNYRLPNLLAAMGCAQKRFGIRLRPIARGCASSAAFSSTGSASPSREISARRASDVSR